MTDTLSREAVAIADQVAQMRREADALLQQADERPLRFSEWADLRARGLALYANADRLERKGAQT